jgi:ligand-binding sensor domain-containing protein
VYGLTIDAAGVLWWGQQSGLFSFDGTTETQVPNFTDEVDALGPRYGNKIAVAQREGGLSMVVDVTDGTVTRQGDVNNNRLGHSYIAFPTP